MLILLFGLTVCDNAGSERCWGTGFGDLNDQHLNRMACRLQVFELKCSCTELSFTLTSWDDFTYAFAHIALGWTLSSLRFVYCMLLAL